MPRAPRLINDSNLALFVFAFKFMWAWRRTYCALSPRTWVSFCTFGCGKAYQLIWSTQTQKERSACTHLPDSQFAHEAYILLWVVRVHRFFLNRLGDSKPIEVFIDLFSKGLFFLSLIFSFEKIEEAKSSFLLLFHLSQPLYRFFCGRRMTHNADVCDV